LAKQDKRELLFEGKTKKFYSTDTPEFLVQEFTDEVTAFDGTKRGKLKKKGELHNEISAYLFEYLESYHVPTHFVRKLTPTEMLVKRLEMIPVEVVVRNIATGNFCKRFGVKEGETLRYPIVEHYYKNEDLDNPLVNEYHLYAFGLATPEEVKTMNRMASKINVVLRSFFERRKLIPLAEWIVVSNLGAIRARSFWVTKFLLIPAVYGIPKHRRNSIRINTELSRANCAKCMKKFGMDYIARSEASYDYKIRLRCLSCGNDYRRCHHCAGVSH
jgi:phosphoribosylaminoimidazole-succinocarboxamide synthase